MGPTPAGLEQQLSLGLLQLDLAVPEVRQRALLEYLALLEKWGRAYNLTGILDRPSMVTYHLLDSLSAAPYVQGPRLLDVGSGAGLPGIPLAVVFPDLAVTLIESRKRRAQFLIHASATLGLCNVETVCERVERYQPADKFDTLLARAFSSIDDFVSKAEHLCAHEGRMVAFKGGYPVKELSGLGHGFTATAVHRVQVPGLAAERHIVVLARRSEG